MSKFHEEMAVLSHLMDGWPGRCLYVRCSFFTLYRLHREWFLICLL